MRIVVLGAGVVGVTTAWELLRDGHQVVLVDREAEAAGGASHANAGLVTPGHAHPWADPSILRTLLRSTWRGEPTFRLRPSLDPHLWRWLWRFLGQCRAARAARNSRAMARLALYSRDRLDRLSDETGLAFSESRAGCLYLHREARALDAAARHAESLRAVGVELRVLDMDAACALDPALRHGAAHYAGAIHSPGDRSGDCRAFVQGLAARLSARGGTLHFDTRATDFACEGDRAAAVKTSRGELQADAFVLALGAHTPRLARRLGAELPIYPVRGLGLTVPVADAHRAPRLGAIDESRLLAYARYGDQLRVTSRAELRGYDTRHRPEEFRGMLEAMRALFPGAAHWDRFQGWAGLRPMTPTGLPVLGRGGRSNVWVNAGQGYLGWTMAAGSARITADLIAGRPPGIDVEPMRLASRPRRAA